MRALLDSSTQRLIRLLEALSNQEDWMTACELSSIIGASERTIAEDVDTLNKRWGHYLDIEISAKKGIRIRNQNTSVLWRILVDLFNDSTALRFLKEILLYPNHGTDFYEDRLFVSRSTLTRLLPKINKYLSKRGISIVRRNNSYRLMAEDEQHLRDFFTAFLIELNGIDLDGVYAGFDLSIPRGITKRILARCLDGPEYDFAANDELTSTFNSIFYFVSLLRENQGCCLSSSYDITGEITEEELARMQKLFPRISAENLKPIHKFIHDQFHGWTSEDERALVTREAAAFWKEIFREIQPLPDTNVVRKLNMVLYSMYFTAKHRPGKTSELFDRVHYFAQSMKKHQKPLYRLVEKNLAVFSKKVGLDLSDRLPDVLFWMFLAFPDFGDFAPQKTAVVVSDFGFRHAEFLAAYISRFFNSDDKPPALMAIPVPVYGEARLPDSLEYDFVITTIPGVSAKGKKAILVNDFPTRENMCEIYKMLMEV